MTYLKDFRQRIEANDYPGFLKIWEEYCYSDEPDPEEFFQILEAIKNSSLKISFGNHVEKGIYLWERVTNNYFSHQILKDIYDLQTTNSEKLLEIALSFLEQKYPNDPRFQEKLRLVGLRSGESFQGSISNFELLTHMQKGNFVFHASGWGVSEIIDVSLIREELTLECDLVVGLKHLSFKNAFHTLIPIPDDHFLARRFGNPDLFEKQARENPAQIIRCLLRDLGPKNASEIKEELCDLVIPSKDWNRWWQTARNKIKKDTKIEIPKDIKTPFKLRKEEVPHEIRFYKALEAKPNLQETIQMVYTFLRDFPETLKNEEFKTSLITKMQNLLNSENLEDHSKLQLHFLLEDLTPQKDSPSDKFIKECKSLPDLLNKLDILAFKKRVLQVVRKTRKDWKELFLSLLLQIDQTLLRDYLIGELLKTPEDLESLKKKLTELLLNPIGYPDIYVWYFQKIMDKKAKVPFSDKEGKIQFFEGFLILLHYLGHKPDYRDLGKKMVALITQGRYKTVRDIFQEAKLQDVQEFLLLATKCALLSDHDIKIIHSLGEVVYPELSHLRKGKEEEAETPVIWTTQEGYTNTQERMQQIATVETVENAREIEEARALGDLRENAEFKAALERRDRLQAELKFLSDQINVARILTEADVNLNEVGVGNIIECKDEKEKVHTYTILGPWDANVEKNILSFQSKFAQAMIGLKVGQTFQLQGETFTITKIKSYFDEK